MSSLALADVLAIRAMEHAGPFTPRPEIDDALDRSVDDAALLAARARKHFEAFQGGSDTILKRTATTFTTTRIVLIVASALLGVLFGVSADWLGNANAEIVKVRRYFGIVFITVAFAVYSLICLVWLWFDLLFGRKSTNLLLQFVDGVTRFFFRVFRRFFNRTESPSLTGAVDYLTRPLFSYRSVALFISRLGCVFTIASLLSAGASAFAMSLFSKPDYEWKSLSGTSFRQSTLEQFPPIRLFSDPPRPELIAYLAGERHGDAKDSEQRLAFTWMLVDFWLLIVAVKLLFLFAYWLTERLIPREFFVLLNSPRDPYPREVITALRTPSATIVADSDPQAAIAEPELSGSPPIIATSETVVAWFDGKLPESFRKVFENAPLFLSLTGPASREEFLNRTWKNAAIGFKATIAPAQKEVRFLSDLREKTNGERVLFVLGDLFTLRENYRRDAARVKARLDDWRSKIVFAGWPKELVVEFDHDAATADSLAQFRAAVAMCWQFQSIALPVGLRKAGRFARAAAEIRKSLAIRTHDDTALLKQTHDVIREIYQREKSLSFTELLQTSLPRTTGNASAAVRNSLKTLESALDVKPEWLDGMMTASATLLKLQTHGRSLAKWGLASAALVAATTLTGGAALLPAAMLPVVAQTALFAGLGGGITATLVRYRLTSAPVASSATVVDDGLDPFVRSLALWSLLLELAGSPEEVLLDVLPKLLDAAGETPIQSAEEANSALARIEQELGKL